MTIVKLVDSSIPDFNSSNYPESFHYADDINVEDVSTHIETYNIATDTIVIEFRLADMYSLTETYYKEYGWYELLPVDDDIWDYMLSYSIENAVRSDFYFYRSFYTVNIIQFNQTTDVYYSWNGNDSWTSDLDAFTACGIKLITTDIVK